MPPSEGTLFRHVGPTLGLVRELLGLIRQAECARRAGVTRAQLSRYETEGVTPALETLGKVLRALGLELGEFFTVMSAVDLLAGSEESLESIRSRVLERQRSVLDEFLAGIARLRPEGGGGGTFCSSTGVGRSMLSRLLPPVVESEGTDAPGEPV